MANQTRPTQPRTLLSQHQVCREFGFAKATVSRAIQDGALKAYRLPGQRRFRIPRSAVLAWIESYPAATGGSHGEG